MRGSNLIKIVLGLLVGSIALLMGGFIKGSPIAVITTLIADTFCLLIIWITQRGHVSFAGIALLIILIFFINLTLFLNHHLSDTPYFMLIPMGVAAAILTPRQIIMLALILLGTLTPLMFIVWQGSTSVTADFERRIAVNAYIIIIASAFLSYLISRSISTFMLRTQGAQQQLHDLNNSLELQVTQRTADLAHALEYQQQQANELRQSLQQQQELSDIVHALSLPLIPVRDNVLVLPLIGHPDHMPSQTILEHVLHEVEQRHARALILDLTGIALVETHLAQTFLRLGQALQLLGATLIIVGIRPEVAQTLVSLNASLSQFQSAASLQEGIAMCGSA